MVVLAFVLLWVREWAALAGRGPLFVALQAAFVCRQVSCTLAVTLN
jgi:hypothetical protein